MKLFRDLPLPRKMMLVIIAACGTTVLLAAGGMVALRLSSFRQDFERDLGTLAHIIADNASAPLAFGDTNAAVELLSTLRAKPDICCACIARPDGSFLARFGSPDTPEELARFPHGEGIRYAEGQLYLSRPILLEKQLLGRLLVRSDYRAEYHSFLKAYLGIVAAVLAGSLALALLLSFRLQRLVSGPILKLVATARQVAEHKDYSVRVESSGQAELGLLTEAFNQMLARIQEHDSTLRQINLSALHKEIAERKRTEAELRKLARAVEQCPVSIVMTDAAGVIEYVNPKFTEVTGYAFAEALGQNPRLLKSGELTPDRYGELWRTITRGCEWRGEFHNRRKNGELFWESASISPIVDEAGNITHFVAVKEDITERKQAERRLAEALNYSQTLLQASPIGIITYQASGQAVSANAAIARIIGTTVDQVRAQNFRQLQSWQTSGLLAVAEAALETGHEQRTEAQFVTSFGKPVWLSGRFVPFQYEGEPHLLALLADVSEQKRAEEALRQSEELYRLITENTTDLISVVDPQGNRLYSSPSYHTVLGYSAEELQKPSAYDHLHPEDRPQVEAVAQDTLRTGQGRVLEYRVQHKDGSWRILESHAGVLLNACQRPSSLLIVARDITERKKAEREQALLQIRLQQAQKLESIGRLAAGIAHEINTPTQFIGDNIRFLQESFQDLQTLLGHYGELRRAAAAGAASTELLARIDTAIQTLDLDYLTPEIPKAISQSLHGVGRVAEIVLAMKEFSHPGSTEKTAVDLNHAIESTVTVARNEWKYVADMVLELQPTLPLVQCLPGEFNQVLLNLITNAAHAITDVVGEGRQRKGTITISTQRQGDWYEVRVADTGRGIPENIRSRMFEPFFTTKPVGKGTGQGLAIARSVIVDKHGGSITFETEVGRGTTFIIRLPLSPTEVARTKQAA